MRCYKVSEKGNVRWGWIKGMYLYTIVMAGGFGLGILLIPSRIQSLFGIPSQDPIVFGILGSVYMAFALLSLLGLRAPLKFAPILLLQLSYKVIWFMGTMVPMLISGRFPSYAILYVMVFASFIIGDLIAIPFSYIFKTNVR